ncbi:MAG: hypothetical protein R3C14_44650 [Caldilineaceae bacterium]
MRLLVIDNRDSSEQHYTLQNRTEYFDLDSTGKLSPTAAKTGLKIEEKGRNVWITDLKTKEQIYLTDRPLPSQTPWLWQANQELRFGPYILLWRATTSAHRQLQPRWLAERVSPRLIFTGLLLFAIGLALLASWLYRSSTRTVYSAQSPAVWLMAYFNSFPTPATSTPTVTPTPLTPTVTITPTLVLTVTEVDKPPTTTPTPTATLSVTETMRLIGAGAVVNGTPVINAHTLQPGAGHWDPRLTDLGVEYEPAVVPIRGQFWRLIDAQWLDETASNGMHHVFVEVLDENGDRILEPVTMTMAWSTDTCVRYMQNTLPLQIGPRQFRPYGMNCPMYNAGKVYSVKLSGFGLPSDLVRNLGLGTPAQRDLGIRTSFLLIFQRTTRTE